MKETPVEMGRSGSGRSLLFVAACILSLAAFSCATSKIAGSSAAHSSPAAESEAAMQARVQEGAGLAKFYFDAGMRAYAANTLVETACPMSLRHKTIFCREGYFTSRFMAENKRKRSKFPEEIARDPKKYAVDTGVLGLGFGMALVGLKKPIRDRLPADPDLFWAFAVDGWGFAQAFEKKAKMEEMVSICRKGVPDPYVEYCLWGAGRAGFFTRAESAPPADSNDVPSRGYRFAEALVSRDDHSCDAQPSGGAPAEAARAIRQFYNGSCESVDPNSMRGCLFGRHVVQCVK